MATSGYDRQSFYQIRIALMGMDILLNAAKSGDGNACLQLAMAWMTGRGVSGQDTAKGRHWLEKASDSGNVEAKRFLGLIYLRGMDVVPDFAKAVALLEDASRYGDAEAAFSLASFLGGARDDWYNADKAIEWLNKAAVAGLPRAQCHLGYCLQHGVLTGQNSLEAVKWFARAAAAGDAGAMLALAEHFQAGAMLPQDSVRAYGLANAAAQKGWSVAGEYAKSLASGREEFPTDMAQLLPRPEEISASHTGSLPVVKPEMLAWQPRAVLMRHFASNFECAEIANAARQHLMPSFVVEEDGRLAKHRVRTSYEVRLRSGLRNIVIQALEQRMAVWSHFPVENAEYPLILHYENSQSFEQHYDYFIPEDFVMGEGPLEFGGQRIATQLIYLNESFEGGETRFDRTDLVLKPERGMCMLFFNTSPDGNVDPFSRHTGVGVTSGEKWLLARWIREIPFDQPARDIKRDQYRQP
jgi:prolyl 4-hydroxylase